MGAGIMVELDAREWLLTNGLGSISSGTVGDARTRTYHGWLIAALDPPAGRTLLLSHLEATLEVGGQVWELGTNFWGDGAIAPLGYQLLRSFETDPCPRWSWGTQNWELTRRLLFAYGLEDASSTHWENRLLMEYRYRGTDPAILRLRPLIGDRNFHHQQSADGMEFSQSVRQQQLYLQAVRYGEPQTPWQLRWSAETIKRMVFGIGTIICPKKISGDWAIAKTFTVRVVCRLFFSPERR